MMVMMVKATLMLMMISINTESQSGSLRILLSHCPSDITALLLPSLFTAVAMNCLGILDLAVRRDNPCPDGLSGSWCASNKFTERVPSTCPQKKERRRNSRYSVSVGHFLRGGAEDECPLPCGLLITACGMGLLPKLPKTALNLPQK